MSTPIDDGGPAFPLEDWDDCIHSKRYEKGMSLRDWFAGQATDEDIKAMPDWNPVNCRQLTRAERRYVWANTMLAARNSTATTP